MRVARMRLLGVSIFLIAAALPAGAAASAESEPAAILPPAIAGSASDGSRLTAFAGEWSGAEPMTLAFQWLRCTAPAPR